MLARPQPGSAYIVEISTHLIERDGLLTPFEAECIVIQARQEVCTVLSVSGPFLAARPELLRCELRHERVQVVAMFAAIDNVLLLSLGAVSMPLGFNDASTLLYWLRAPRQVG